MADNSKKRDQLSLTERQSRGLVAPEDLPYTGMASEVSLDEDAWTALEKRIKLPLGTDSREAFTRALNDMLINIALRPVLPRQGETRQFLEMEESPLDARKVNQDLRRIDKYAQGLVDLIEQRPRYAAQIAVEPVVENDASILVDILRRISITARRSKFFRRAGRTPHKEGQAFAIRVTEVWREAWLDSTADGEGHGAYWDPVNEEFRGPAVEIIKTLHEAAAQAYEDSDSLPVLSAILEALRPRNK